MTMHPRPPASEQALGWVRTGSGNGGRDAGYPRTHEPRSLMRADRLGRRGRVLRGHFYGGTL